MGNYRKSILEYNDVRNAVDYAREEGREESKIQIIQKCVQMNLPIEIIIGLTGYSREQINRYMENSIQCTT